MAAAAPHAGVVFLCNPNNPTGTVQSASAVRDFIARVKDKAMGQEVMGSLSPGQALVGIVHRELANPLQIGHVVQEAIHMSAIVVTAIPEAYAGQDLVVLKPGESHTTTFQVTV